MNRKISLHSVAVVTMLTLIALSATPAHGFRMIQNFSAGRVSAGSLVTCNNAGGFVHWTNPNIPWRLNTAGQGWNKAGAISSALATWRNVAGASHNPTYAGTTTRGWATDGTNTALWASGNGCTGNCLALTAIVLQAGQKIVETDVTFNSSYFWRTDGNTYDTQTVATHEFGHTLGIHHTELGSTPRPTMYATYFGSGGRSLEADDRAALVCAQTRYPFGGITPPPPPPPPSNIPGVPNSFRVLSDFCFGWVGLTWSAVSGATRYEVQKSSSASFPWAVAVYTGPWTSFSGNVANKTGRTYFRVRACNANGCGGYRNGGSVRYYDICL